LENKQKVIEDIMACTEKYPNVFLFSVDNMRNSTLKYIRNEWKDSRFFFGKNAIMRLGLKQAEIDDDLCEKVEGQRGLLFTEHDKETVVDWFKEYSAAEFARSGNKATETVVLPEGPLPDFSHAIEPHLRKLGMPTKLERGIVTLISDYTVCEKGHTLTPEQAKILKLIGRQIATFRVNVECCVTKEDGFEVIQMPKPDKKSLKKSMKAKEKLQKKAKKSKKDESDEDTSMMEIAAGSDDDEEEDDDEDDDDSDAMEDSD
jgi:mRNA turnover protein 4